jgi:hypothetical protein
MNETVRLKYTRTAELERRHAHITQEAYKQGFNIQGFHFGEYVTARYKNGVTELYNFKDKGHEAEFLETHDKKELIIIKIGVNKNE